MKFQNGINRGAIGYNTKAMFSKVPYNTYVFQGGGVNGSSKEIYGLVLDTRYIITPMTDSYELFQSILTSVPFSYAPRGASMIHPYLFQDFLDL